LSCAENTEYQLEPSIGSDETTPALMTPGSAAVRVIKSSNERRAPGSVQASPVIETCIVIT
jgi:hypothetical protein